MGLVWWVIPAICGVAGLMLLFAGFGKLAKMKAFSGLVRLVFGTAFAGLGVAVALLGLSFQTYERLTYERDVATVSFAAIEDQPGVYKATLTLADGSVFTPPDGTDLIFRGDEFSIGAQVLKFKPMANIVGYDSMYRLDYMSSLNTADFQAQTVTEGRTDRINLYPSDIVDMKALARGQGARFGLRDAEYGSASFQKMGDGYEYEVSMTQDAIVARPTDATRLMREQQSYPGFLTRQQRSDSAKDDGQ